jgi:hypothetical protein
VFKGEGGSDFPALSESTGAGLLIFVPWRSFTGRQAALFISKGTPGNRRIIFEGVDEAE